MAKNTYKMDSGMTGYPSDVSDEESLQQAFLGIIRGARSELLPSIEAMDGRRSALEAAHVQRMTRCSAVGSPATIRRELEALIEEATNADEIVATAQIFDHAAPLRSFEIAASVIEEINAARTTTHPNACARAKRALASSSKTTWTDRCKLWTSNSPINSPSSPARPPESASPAHGMGGGHLIIRASHGVGRPEHLGHTAKAEIVKPCDDLM